MKIYVCGPMSNLPDLNYPFFNEVAALLRARGHEVINPAENEDGSGRTWLDFMRISIAQVVSVDALYLLPGWNQSRGASLEAAIAGHLGHKFFIGPEVTLLHKTVIRKALIGLLFYNEKE